MQPEIRKRGFHIVAGAVHGRLLRLREKVVVLLEPRLGDDKLVKRFLRKIDDCGHDEGRLVADFAFDLITFSGFRRKTRVCCIGRGT